MNRKQSSTSSNPEGVELNCRTEIEYPEPSDRGEREKQESGFSPIERVAWRPTDLSVCEKVKIHKFRYEKIDITVLIGILKCID